MKLTGSRILLECLKFEGVDTVFGYPGGTVINIYDDLMDSSIKHILTRHEQAAVHAADGYARLRAVLCFFCRQPNRDFCGANFDVDLDCARRKSNLFRRRSDFWPDRFTDREASGYYDLRFAYHHARQYR